VKRQKASAAYQPRFYLFKAWAVLASRYKQKQFWATTLALYVEVVETGLLCCWFQPNASSIVLATHMVLLKWNYIKQKIQTAIAQHKSSEAVKTALKCWSFFGGMAAPVRWIFYWSLVETKLANRKTYWEDLISLPQRTDPLKVHWTDYGDRACCPIKLCLNSCCTFASKGN